MGFKKATKTACKARVALYGPAGSGKTYTALRIAKGMGGKIAVIDTEFGSASKYADWFDFDTLELRNADIDNYIDAMEQAHGYDALIMDSITHGWQELCQEVEKLAHAKFKGNTWSAWSEGTPKQRRFIKAIVSFPGHIIVTMRSKTEWTQEDNGKGRKTPTRVGLAPEQGKGAEYEFDLLMSLTVDHVGMVEKDRSGKFQDQIIEKPGEEFGRELAAWLSDGAPAQPQEEPSSDPLESLSESERSYCIDAAQKIQESTTEDELKAIAAVLSKKPQPVKEYLRPIYTARMSEVKTAA